MARLFQKGPMTVFMAVPSDQGVLDTGDKRSYDRMQQVEFESIDEGAEEMSVGFVVLEDYRSTNFGPSVVEFGPYVVGSLRLDVRKVPKSALDKLTDDMIDAERDKTEADEDGTVHLSKARRKELRELAALKLRAKVPPTIKVVDFWWNQTTGLVFLTDKSKGVVEVFVDLFESAFGPEFLLSQVDIGNILPNSENVEFNVAQDFLTWLWGLRDKSQSFAAGGMEFMAYIEKQVTISDNHKSLDAKFDDDTTEIDTGVKLGLRVSKALVRIEYGEESNHWCTFTLDSKMFPLAEVSIPNAKCTPGQDFDGALLQQIGTVEEAFARFRLLLVSYATGHRPEVIAKGLSQGDLATIRETPDTMSQYLEEGQRLLSVCDVHFLSKPYSAPVEEPADEAA